MFSVLFITPAVALNYQVKHKKRSGLNKPFARFTRFIAGLTMGLILLTSSPHMAQAIVGGSEATRGLQPWAVGLAMANESNGYYAQFCGGSLIDDRWVLTAAHCTYDEEGYPFKPDELDVFINRHHLDKEQGERIRVKRIVRHPAFVARTFNADLALLLLTNDSEHTPILIAKESNQITSDSATVFGWGVNEHSEPVNALHQVSIPLVERGTCASLYRDYDRMVNRNMRCAGFLEGGKDACIGDSGGPLAMQNDETGEWIQIGIVSWGEGCGDANAYGVYTDLTAFDRWIQVQMLYHGHNR